MQNILDALRWRYAVKIFDSSKSLRREDLETILEAGRLAPSCYGIEPWHFLVIENVELRQKLRAASYDQPKVTNAPYLIVVARRTDARAHITEELVERTAKAQGVDVATLEGLKGMVGGDISSRSDAEVDAWVRAQTYLPLGIMVETAALLGVDAGPMEGSIPDQVDEILGLSAKHLRSTTMLALGYRGEDPAAKRAKVRRSTEEVVTFVV